MILSFVFVASACSYGNLLVIAWISIDAVTTTSFSVSVFSEGEMYIYNDDRQFVGLYYFYFLFYTVLFTYFLLYYYYYY